MLSQYLSCLEKERVKAVSYVDGFEVMTWLKTSTHGQSLSNAGGKSVISNSELKVLVNAKKPSLSASDMSALRANYFPASQIEYLRNHPQYGHTEMRYTCYTIPVVDEKIKNNSGDVVNKSQKSKAEGEYMV